MIEYSVLFWMALVDLSYAMAPYILFGLFFAGILHEVVPDTLVTKHLGKESISSVLKSTLFGIPLPVCSCGVIPLATSIKKSGASKGATLSFLISTPITGVDSILATYGIFGWIFTLYRIFTSIVIAITAGILTNLFDNEPENKSTDKSQQFSQTVKHKESCCSNNSCDESEPKKKFSLNAALHYAFVTLIKDIAKPLFWGLLLGALITIAIPQNLSEILIEFAWLSYLIAIAIAIPMYVCATASLPIAAALMLSGVSAGAAFVFLTAGPATNTVTIGVVKKLMGRKSLSIYLGSILVGSILFGLGLDFVFSINVIDPKSLIHLHEESGWITILSTAIMWGLIIYFILEPYLKKSSSCCSDENCQS